MNIPTFKNISIESSFEKIFNFTKLDVWKIPKSIIDDNLNWKIEYLTSLKQNLNATKSLLNDQGEDWHAHTAAANKAANILNVIKNRIQPELLNQAWCKFYEVLSNFNLFESCSENIQTLHLCEAPGAFISALNYYLCVNHPTVHWDWIANALNPYYEGHSIRTVVVDDRLLFPTLRNWFFSKTNTGDITDPDCMNDICSVAEEIGYFNLVTADGSIDCLDNPGEQESIVAKLHFAEIIIALRTLLKGGSFVIKKFTFFECNTICQMYLLNCAFEKVHVFKPFTSRPSNSEVYVICIGFQGSEALSNILTDLQYRYDTKNLLPIFPESEIPNTFLEQLKECSTYFADFQIASIKENIALFPLTDVKLIQSINNLKITCAERFVEKYSLNPSELYNSCKLYSTKKKIVTSFYDKTNKDHKSIYFQAVGDTFNNIKKSENVQWQQKLLNIEARLNALFPLSKKRTKEEYEWCFPWKEIGKKMRSKNYQNWITKGRKVKHIENSKFCYPVLLYLWNQVSGGSTIDYQFYKTTLNYWPFDALGELLSDNTVILINEIFAIFPAEDLYEKDTLLKGLSEELKFEVNFVHFHENTSSNILKSTSNNKIVFINTTTWADSLHQECILIKTLTNGIFTALKLLHKGDIFILCVQSVLTRYSAGLLFIIMSLFERFIVLIPEDSKYLFPAQIWIFKNFQEQVWLNNVLEYLSLIQQQHNLKETSEVLEIVPMTSLCGGLFHIHLREANNKLLLQRLRNLLASEKLKLNEHSISCI